MDRMQFDITVLRGSHHALRVGRPMLKIRKFVPITSSSNFLYNGAGTSMSKLRVPNRTVVSTNQASASNISLGR
jgi:hypothetical protein